METFIKESILKSYSYHCDTQKIQY